jgi:hypothetical protein
MSIALTAMRSAALASSNQPRQSEENSYESKSFNANEEARIYPGDA